MGRKLTHQDAHVLINALMKEIDAENATITATDTSSFISVGETILTYNTENILNAIGILAGKRYADTRDYTSPFYKLRAENHGIFSNLLGTFNYYSQGAIEDGSTNTQLFTNLAEGFDNGRNPTNLGVDQSTASMWEQHQAMVAELWFAGSSTWQDCLTRYADQLQYAFRGEDEFIEFWSGVMTEKKNDIEQQKEAYDRAAVLNFLAGIYDMDSNMPGSKFNATYEFNQEFGTSYTTDQLKTTYINEFSTFLAEKLKNITGLMKNRSRNYHWSIPKTVGLVTYHVLRNTPLSAQRFLMIEQFWNKIESRVKPAIFNEQYISFGNFIPVPFWQNENDPYAISVTPAIPDTSDPTEQTAGDAVALDNVLGVIFDERALMTDYQLEDTSTTPKEARKHYYNTWWTFRRNAINNFSHKAVLIYMEDPATP